MKLLLLASAILAGMLQDGDFLSAVLSLSGAGTPEELTESEMERYESLARHPIRINLSSRSHLLSCGLFSTYQVASMCDYIASYGDILSASELGMVNGFNPDLACSLAHFISFDSHAPPGKSVRRKARQDALLGFAAKGRRDAYSIKYHLSHAEKAEVYVGGRKRYTDSSFGKPDFCCSVYGKRAWNIILGDFNARLGQGLLAWSGMTLSGVPTVAALRKNPGGFSPTSSFSPGFRGICAGWFPGRTAVRAAVATDGSCMASFSLTGKTFNAGFNALLSGGNYGISSDWQLGMGHFLWYGESALSSGGPAILSGMQWSPAYKSVITILGRYYSRDYFCDHAGAVRSASKVSDEAGASLAAQYRRLLFTLDTAIHPERIEKQKKNQHGAKMLVDASPVLGIGKFTLAPSLRWTEKLTDSRRHDLRADLSVSREPFSVKWRLNLVKCENTGWLSYTEVGYKYGRDSSRLRVSLFLRGTFYDTPDWETRIYCYERDIPGSFSVPACYGRGYSYSAIFSLKLRSMQNIRHTINLRATIAEALHGGSIASRRELKMQYQVDL